MISLRNLHRDSSQDTGKYYIGVSWDYLYEILLDSTKIGLVYISEGASVDSIYIEWIEIAERHRGKGYMGELLDCIQREFANKRYIRAQASDEYLGMYMHLGFEFLGRDPNTFFEMSNIGITNNYAKNTT